MQIVKAYVWPNLTSEARLLIHSTFELLASESNAAWLLFICTLRDYFSFAPYVNDFEASGQVRNRMHICATTSRKENKNYAGSGKSFPTLVIEKKPLWYSVPWNLPTTVRKKEHPMGIRRVAGLAWNRLLVRNRSLIRMNTKRQRGQGKKLFQAVCRYRLQAYFHRDVMSLRGMHAFLQVHPTPVAYSRAYQFSFYSDSLIQTLCNQQKKLSRP